MTMTPVSLRRSVGNQPDKPINSQRVLEVFRIQIVFPVSKAEPEERLQRLAIDIDRAGVLPARNALENHKAVAILNQPFRPGLSAVEKSVQYFPAVSSRRKPKVGNGQDIVHVQAAKQLALRVAAKTMRHGDVLLYG
jgi:hypothetical protein